MAIVQVCGFNCHGIDSLQAVAPLANAPPGYHQHQEWAVSQTYVVHAATGLGDGLRALKVDHDTSANTRLGLMPTYSSSVMVGAFVFVVREWPATDEVQLGGTVQSLSTPLRLRFLTATNEVRWSLSGAGAPSTLVGTAFAIQKGRWYCADFKQDFTGQSIVSAQITDIATGAVTVMVNALQQGESGSVLSGIVVGLGGMHSSMPSTGTVEFTSLAISDNLADYPLGARAVRGIRPARDGTHNVTTSGNFKKDNSTNIDGTETNLYTWLDDDVRWGTDATRISVPVIASNDYVEIRPPADIGITDTPSHMTVVASMGMETTAGTSAGVSLKLRSGTNEDAMLNNGTPGVNSILFVQQGKAYNTLPGGGALSKSGIENLSFRWGYATAVTPIPYLGILVLEVQYPLRLIVPQGRFNPLI